MPNQRAENMRLLPVKVQEKFLVEIRKGMRQSRRQNMSAFVREAITEKLAALGIEVPPELADAADRMGKGGRPRGLYGEHQAHLAQLNDSATKPKRKEVS